MKPTFEMGKGLFWMSGLLLVITGFLILFKSPFFFQVVAFQPQEVKMDIQDLSDRTQQETLVLVHSESREEREALQAVETRLTEMAVPYKVEDYRVADWEKGVQTIILLSEDWTELDTKGLLSFVENGGSLMVAHRPSPERSFQSIYQQLGIIEYGSFVSAERFQVHAPFFMVEESMELEGSSFRQSMLALRVNEEAHVVVTAEASNPLLWTVPLGEGQVVFFNGIFTDEDTFIPLLTWMITETITPIYPVLYTGAAVVDGFPFPTQMRKEMNGTSEKNYYRQHWWLSLQSLEAKFDLNLTASAVYPLELTEDNLYDDELELFAREILLLGGEIAIKESEDLPAEQRRLQRVLGDYTIRSTFSKEGTPQSIIGDYFFSGNTLAAEPDTEDLWRVIQNATNYGFREVAISPYRMDGTDQDEHIWREWNDFLKQSNQLYDAPFLPITEVQARLEAWRENQFFIERQTDRIDVEMSHFVNPSYFHLRTSKRIGQTVDCHVTKIGEDLYLVQANSPRFSIEME